MPKNSGRLTIVVIAGAAVGSILSIVQIALYVILEVSPWSGLLVKMLTWNMVVVSNLMFRRILPSHDGDQIQALEGLAYAFLFGAALNTFLLTCVWFLARKTLLENHD